MSPEAHEASVEENPLANSLENTVLASIGTIDAPPPFLGRTKWTALFESFRHLNVTLHTGWIETVLNNGQSNYLTQEVIEEMESLLEAVSECKSIKCVVLSGGDKRVFSRGLELKSFLAISMTDQLRFIERSNVLLSAVAALPVPAICAINGVCSGAGLELAIACDIRIASEEATFSSPEALYGLIPGGGVLQRLLRQVGRGQCIRLLSSGTIISAAEALGIGLIEEIAKAETLADRCERFARRLAKAPRSALVAIKKSVVEGLDLPMSAAVHSDLRRSLDALQQLQEPRSPIES